jgi:D-tyrosyl-tRNA(Tyr) deacylase
VSVDDAVVGSIGRGFLALVGVGRDDGPDDAREMAGKIAGLRVFDDEAGDMNLDLAAVGGEVLAVSQFTLQGDARRGRRPSFIAAARPEAAEPLYEEVVAELRRRGITVATGIFGATMAVGLVNDGPVTILLDTKRMF